MIGFGTLGSMVMTVSNERKGRRHNSLRFTIVATPEEWVHTCAVRSICFLDEHGAQAKWLFDGNDYQCTHVLAYDGDEPIGTGRIRWFKDFAKIKRNRKRASRYPYFERIRRIRIRTYQAQGLHPRDHACGTEICASMEADTRLPRC